MSDLDADQPLPDVRIEHLEWSRNATNYQIDTRQFTPEGTFRAAEDHLPQVEGTWHDDSVADDGPADRRENRQARWAARTP